MCMCAGMKGYYCASYEYVDIIGIVYQYSDFNVTCEKGRKALYSQVDRCTLNFRVSKVCDVDVQVSSGEKH